MKLFSNLFSSILMGLIITSNTINAQSYSVSPAGYTSPVYANVTCTNSYGNPYTAHGQGVIVAKASVSGNTVTFTVKKSSGTFSKDGNIYARSNDPCGSALTRGVKYSAGSNGASISLRLDFTTGSKKYVLAAVSKNGEMFYTNPITISAKPAVPQVAKLRLSQAMGFLNGTNMEVGKSYRFRATVENHGNKPWRGAFFLKHGSTNLNAWSGSVVQA
ncbi:hypothetical protein, partial [Tannerella forsythia]